MNNRHSRALRAEAAAWIAKLHGPERSPELEDDFRDWLKADPAHAAAFEHVTGIWDDLANVRIGGLPRLATEGVVERRWRGTGRLTVAVACCAALIIATVAWLLRMQHVYATEIGEQRIVTIEDGSRLYLNSNTRLDVDIEERSRRIELQRGEAYFEVAKDPARPFIVVAGDRTVTALGTSFVVRYDRGRTAVTLIEGKVTVSPTLSTVVPVAPEDAPRSGEWAPIDAAVDMSAKQPQRSAPVTQHVAPGTEASALALHPGQRVTFDASGSATVDTPRPDTTAAWRRGEVILDETPLSAAISEMNRYSKTRIVLDPVLRPLRVSGIYRTGNNPDFARAIATIHDLEVVMTSDEIQLRRK